MEGFGIKLISTVLFTTGIVNVTKMSNGATRCCDKQCCSNWGEGGKGPRPPIIFMIFFLYRNMTGLKKLHYNSQNLHYRLLH